MHRHRVAVAAFSVIATVWALWLLRDRLALAVTLALGCAVVLVLGLRKKPRAAVGTLQVDDLGRVFWNGSSMQPTQWHRAERSVWIRLEPETVVGLADGERSILSTEVFAAASTMAAEDWAALQRWLVWLERDSGSSTDR